MVTSTEKGIGVQSRVVRLGQGLFVKNKDLTPLFLPLFCFRSLALSVFLLVMFVPYTLLGAERVSDTVISSKTQQLKVQAPQTPEEFLLPLKELMDNPDLNAYDFGERILGIPRDQWKSGVDVSGSSYIRYYFLRENAFRPTVYYRADLYVPKKISHVIRFSSYLPLDTEGNYIITAKDVRKIWGKPTKMTARLVDKNRQTRPDFPYIKYLYKGDSFELVMKFKLTNTSFKERNAYKGGKVKKIRKQMKRFDFHEDARLYTIDFRTSKK